MIKSMKRLWKDRRGNVLAITAAAVPLVVGSAGLATDTIQWVTWKRELQRAADSAAFAGVLSKAAGASTATAAVNADLTKNQTTGIALLAGYPAVTYPNQVGWTSPVRVTLKIQKRLGFSSMFLSAAPTITATATAALIDSGDFCLYALEDGTDPGITVGGSAHAAIGCNANSNSIGNPSIQPNGSAYSITAPMMSGAGNMPTSITGVTELRPYQMPQPDPFKDQYSTDVPPSTPCSSMNSHQTMTQGGQNKIYSLTPGCYNDFRVTSTNETYNLAPGVYYLNNTDFDISGGHVIGTGVTIILTGTSPGTIKTNGNADVQLTAPTSTTDPYYKMLFIQSTNAAVDNVNNINGTSTSKWDGSLYFPKGKVSFTGTGGSTTKCLMVVSKKIDFSGTSDIQNNVSGCYANQKKPGKVIRLVG